MTRYHLGVAIVVQLIGLGLCGSIGLAEDVAPENFTRLSYVNDIAPILTKSGCNGGACHAKAGVGQNGFILSLLGFETLDDYDHLVKGERGRRISVSAPEQSLILLKATATVPHVGGKRLEVDSESYRTLVQWIEQGLYYGSETDPKLEGIQVEPAQLVMAPQAQQQLRVVANFTDGSKRDVTSMSLFETNLRSMAEVDDHGLVKTLDIPGNVAIMVRYQGKASVFTASVPLGAPVENLPAPKNFVDELVFANLQRLGIPPSPVCDDATFLRRVSLDIAGSIPTLAETEAFLADTNPNKRDELVEALLASPNYADFFANKWSALLKNRRDENSDKTANFAFHSWLRDSLVANKPYDELVTELLGATGDIVGNPSVAWYKRVREPETQLEDVAQLFLGVRMKCAQCHHHPFEKWSQDDYYHLAAFFKQIGRKATNVPQQDIIFHQRGIAQAENPKSRKMLKPAPLGGEPLEIQADDDPRLLLAEWMRQPDNPFFAKALVNRYWKHFFKRGLIDPEDDIRDTNPPSNPELLDALAKHFVESGYDLKEIIRTITQSQTYQFSSVPNDANLVDQQNYSRYYPRHIPAEVFLDAVNEVTGNVSSFPDVPVGMKAIALPDNSYNRSSYFLSVFGRPEGQSVCECERVDSSNLAQSLHLINSGEIRQMLAAGNGRAALMAANGKTVNENVSELYRVVYSREPRPEELDVAHAYLLERKTEGADPAADVNVVTPEAYQDLIWALINTKEFRFNH